MTIKKKKNINDITIESEATITTEMRLIEQQKEIIRKKSQNELKH